MSVADTTDVVMDWANYVNLAGALDNVETSRVQGNYDWRSYLHEEAEVACQREAERIKANVKNKKPGRAPPTPPAPHSLYA